MHTRFNGSVQTYYIQNTGKKKAFSLNLRKIHLVGNSITKNKNDSEIVSWSNNGQLIIELDKKKKKK